MSDCICCACKKREVSIFYYRDGYKFPLCRICYSGWRMVLDEHDNAIKEARTIYIEEPKIIIGESD